MSKQSLFLYTKNMYISQIGFNGFNLYFMNNKTDSRSQNNCNTTAED